MATDGRTDRLTDVKANVSGAEPEIVSGNEFFGMRLFMIRSNSQSLLEKGSNGDLSKYRLEDTIKNVAITLRIANTLQFMDNTGWSA